MHQIQCSGDGVVGLGRDAVLEGVLSGYTSLTQCEHQSEVCHTA